MHSGSYNFHLEEAVRTIWSHTAYNFSWNFWTVELNKNNVFSLVAAYPAKITRTLKFLKFSIINLMHIMTFLNNFCSTLWTHNVKYINCNGWNDGLHKQDAFTVSWDKSLVKRNYTIILVLKTCSNFQCLLQILDRNTHFCIYSSVPQE